VVSSDWAPDCTSEIVFLLIVFGSAKRVCHHTGSVKNGVLVVLKERAMKIIRPRFVAEVGDSSASLAILRGII